MRKLELKIPPVLIFFGSILLMYWLHTLTQVFVVPLPLPKLVFTVCFGLSGVFGLGGIAAFRQAKTSVHPVNLEKVSALVSSGVYKVTRNPMYLGLLLLLFGFGYWLQNALSLSVCVLFVLYMNRFQIVPEERYMEQKFAQDYRQYKQKVRRWI